MADALMMEGFTNSIWIGLGVVCLSVPIGLAAAIVMTQVHRRVRSLYYTIVVSPVLTPGVILGISTLVFWDRLGTLMDADYERSEEHTSDIQSLMRISYAVFCLKKKNKLALNDKLTPHYHLT